jgi:hypothetical protein
MTTDRLKEMLGVKPFRPFGLRLADGEIVRVEHPELISLSPLGRTVVVWGRNDSMKVLDLFLVTSLETLSKAKSNGRKRK